MRPFFLSSFFNYISSYGINFFKTFLNFLTEAITTTDHKLIGQLYIFFGFFSSIIGTFLSYLIRMHLMHSDQTGILLDNVSLYNSIVTLHGIIMIFMLW